MKIRMGTFPRVASVVGVMTVGAAVLSVSAQVANAPPRADVEPLGVVGVPDVNELGLLDRTGPNAGTWKQITNPGQKQTLKQLGKALFWDMQVGGDGIVACASCHFHAGADNRLTNQVAAGSGDWTTDLTALNTRLTTAHFNGTTNNAGPNRGFNVSEAALTNGGHTPDAADGTPGAIGILKPAANVDINDIGGSHGVREGSHHAVTANRVDTATLKTTSDLFGVNFPNGDIDTVRQVTGRNSPSVLNTVYNLRNFWDGRADAFFNGVSPLGFRDQDARVKVFANGVLGDERLDIPFSSLASQAVGPIGSEVEMVFSGRAHRELGKKLIGFGTVPLAGQTVSATDSLLGSLRNADGRGLGKPYAQFIRQTFDRRFWGDANGNDVCLDNAGNAEAAVDGACPNYTLMQWNFALFFGLGVQAYEATLTTPTTIVDIIAGGVATGVLRNGVGRNQKVVDTAGLALPGCIALLQINNNANQVANATRQCTEHYAKFIDVGATSGTESATAPFPVPNGAAIGGCTGAPDCTVPLARRQNGVNTLMNVERGLGRFFAGATACSICHFNPEFTGATVSTVTGFGAILPALPPGQLRRELAARALMERMPIFSGAAAVYDTGFYNIGVRPTPEDVSLGDQIGGVPLAYTKIFEILAGGSPTSGGGSGVDVDKTIAVANAASSLSIPFQPNDLRPVPFPIAVGCGVGLVGGGNANNNPAANCVPTVIANERLQRQGAFKAPGLRNAKFTGPYMHNGSKKNIRQVLEFYKTAGHFTNLNFNNLDAGMRVFNLGADDESAVVEMIETGLTDWRVAYQRAPFDHPELCVTNGHDPATGSTRVVGIPAVGAGGSVNPIATFEEMLNDMLASSRANFLRDPCTVPGVALDFVSQLDTPPAP